MKLHELSPVEGSKKDSKRIGRGHGSGWGKTSGKGHKGHEGSFRRQHPSRILRGGSDAFTASYP